MTSKEALKNFIKTLCEYETDTNNKESVYPCWHRIILEDLERLEKVEKDLKQTKSNFKNSQTHSRNCYKKLLDRYMGLEKENQELKEKVKILEENQETVLTTLESAVQENQKLKNTILSLELDTCIPELRKENEKLKKVIDIFKGFSLGLTMYGGSETSYGLDANNSIILTKEQYELLKEVLRNVKD